MNGWSIVFLAIIAVATLVMAIVQIGVILVAGRLARRVDRLADQVERELKPMFGHLDAIGRDAARMAAVAASQVDRADRLLVDVVKRTEAALIALQTSIESPAREGRALLAGLRATLGSLRSQRGRSGARQRAEDEDALFI